MRTNKTKYSEIKPEAIRLYTLENKSSAQVVELMRSKYGLAPAPVTILQWVRDYKKSGRRKSTKAIWLKMSKILQSGDPDRFNKAMEMLERAGIDHQVATQAVIGYWAGGHPKGSFHEQVFNSWRKAKEKEEMHEEEPEYELQEAA